MGLRGPPLDNNTRGKVRMDGTLQHIGGPHGVRPPG